MIQMNNSLNLKKDIDFCKPFPIIKEKSGFEVK